MDVEPRCSQFSNTIPEEDLIRICDSEFIRWTEFAEKTVFITGSTGLIGSTLTEALLYANEKRKLDLKILALVRDVGKAKERFADQLEAHGGSLQFIVGNVEELPQIQDNIDYIIHGASQTSSKAFIEHPVETIRTSVIGTENILKLAYKKNVSSMVYLSSMEVYGHPERGHKVSEDEYGTFSPFDLRNSYPLSKQLCEMMCCAYANEYNVPVKIARLTQTFGPGIHYNDNRIFAEFEHCVIEKRDIVLKTKGETERSYIYAADAVSAILTILLKGISGTAYNVADENTYCSIADMAEKAAKSGNINVRFEIEDEKENGYPDPLYMDLDTSRLKELGWTPGGTK